MNVVSEIISYASGLSSAISTAALIATIYYYRKQTQLQQNSNSRIEKTIFNPRMSTNEGFNYKIT
uniref:Uncharacterized protein n=1 Tax=uncultured organism TaxID=155900 RepID=A0A0G2YLB0_9ZZZZ|nr:hypothetical protein [uncultured organism]